MVDRVCGTGGWGSAPLPGDPDNNSVLTVTPAFGGIDVEWTYPEINPGAVSHIIIYRSTAGTAEYAVQHKIVNGTFFYDRIDNATPVRYYYWIRIVSIHGTRGELIGPASAIPRRTIEQTMRDLTGLIDQGVLATSLREEIGLIQTNKQELYDEMALRAANDDALGVAFNEVQAHAEETRALLQEEVQARADTDSAFVDSVNTVYATIGEEVAALQVSQSAFAERVDGDLVDLGAQFTVVADVNGLIGGFGVYNDGSIVEAGFDVDRFWVGRTETDGTYNGTKPFIIEGQETFIKEAVIQNLKFNKLRADDGSLIVENGKLQAHAIDTFNLHVASSSTFSGDVASDNYVSGSTGWIIKQNGKVEFNEATIRGNLEVNTITVNGNSPFGAIMCQQDDAYSANTSTTSVSAQIIAEDWITEMPENSRIMFSLNLDQMQAILSRGGTAAGTYWQNNSGSTPMSFEYTYIFQGYVRLRVRVLVDGVSIYDKTWSETRNSDTSGTISVNPPDEEYEWRYPAYRETSHIECIVDVQAVFTETDYDGSYGNSSRSYDYDNTYSSGSIQVGQTLLSGDIFRLG